MKLRVENLAKIKEAEVEVKNLTLFVGQNSTHKSYMAHVIYEFYKEVSNLKDNYGIFSRFGAFISKKVQQQYKNEIEYLLSLRRELTEEIEERQIDVDEWQDEEYTRLKIFINKEDEKLVVFFNDILDLLLTELTKKINNSFNVDKEILKNLYIENMMKILDREFLSIAFSTPLSHFEEEHEEVSYKIINNIVNFFLDNLHKKLNNYHSSYYFPASRTGFVLTLDEIYAGIFRDKFRGQVSATRLGEPTIDFIQTFADIKTGKINEKNLFSFFSIDKKNSATSEKLISFLENNIIKGKIKEQKNEQDYTNYYLSVNGIDLELHLASSATLETLPFIVFLRNIEKLSKTIFVIEEPEAHLHPKAQIQMAKFIIMLSNAGAKVLVTTHSDYILNEINNCIKLNSLEEKNEFAISKDDVSAYLFKNEENETTVKALDIDKFGIANDNFDEVLDELLDKSSELSERILDND
ncbi:AAA family ATPase [Sulfurimonas sp.]|uniref:AAA family ATPase n=1 Tax=Sulfurimonas sp. TaxID=2022749 RepID=UPI002B45E8F1|nr:AAA family ATPase [Sulfurimonas sp.]